MFHLTDKQRVDSTQNSSRYFVEHRPIAWVLLISTIAWGWFGYGSMPQRKDPVIPVRVAVAVTPWPGVSAAEVEQQISRVVEEKIAENPRVHPSASDSYGIKSISLQGLSIVYVQLAESVTDVTKEFSDINLKLNALSNDLPRGAGPIQFRGDFGETTALMLTVASPKIDRTEIAIRSKAIKEKITSLRNRINSGGASRTSLIYSFPQSIMPEAVQAAMALFSQSAREDGVLDDVKTFSASGFIGIDGESRHSAKEIEDYVANYIKNRVPSSSIHPDVWGPVIIQNLDRTELELTAKAGDKYSYKELDEFTDLIARSLGGVQQASKHERKGVIPEEIYIDYSQERLASYGFQPSRLADVLQSYNIPMAAGFMEAGGKMIYLTPKGKYNSVEAINDTIVGAAADGSPVYLRDMAMVSKGYQSPARYLNYYTGKNAAGDLQRSRAITVAISMRDREKIAEFGRGIDERIADLKTVLPSDLIMARTSDQPRQVKESIALFMDSLNEAIILVVIVSLIGFWEWRSALLMALSIPITLAMTFGMASILGVELQQVSVVSLILALGLLVDDPVVAGDAIKRSLADGHNNLIASWLGPTKLAKAILFATLTNIAAYLPFLMITGDTGTFLHSMPIVMTCSLVASRIVSMWFIPLLGYYILRPSNKPEPTMEERRTTGFTGLYARIAAWSIRHRWKVLIGSLPILILGGILFLNLKTLFFPDDVQYWSTVDIRLPNNATLESTRAVSIEAEKVIQDTALGFDRMGKRKKADEAGLLHSITSFIGGGGPRFWMSISPELPQPNYAQIIIELNDKDMMPVFTDKLQVELSARIPGAQLVVKQLQTNPVEFPIEIMISSIVDGSGERSDADIKTLYEIGDRVHGILSSIPIAANVRTDWQPASFSLGLEIDSARANLTGFTNMDLVISTSSALNGKTVSKIQDNDRQIPVTLRLRPDERAQLSDINNLYINSAQTAVKLPLAQIAKIEKTQQTQRIQRRDHFRTLSVLAKPIPGALASEVLALADSELKKLERSLPPGYKMIIGGEQAKQITGFKNLSIVMVISIVAIFITLVLQFNHAIKPLLVFAAVPYGVVGSIVCLAVTHTPFGFMALLGIASLIGVIVSHIIVLFDFIEEKHEEEEDLEQSLVDAGIMRLRPVMITVGATVLALIPLSLHGGPLWIPLCYAQIGGLTAATFVTLLLVPVLYSICVRDLKIIDWETKKIPSAGDEKAGH